MLVQHDTMSNTNQCALEFWLPANIFNRFLYVFKFYFIGLAIVTNRNTT